MEDLTRREFIKVGTATIVIGSTIGMGGCSHVTEPVTAKPAPPRTSTARPDFDVIIVGAGPGGCLAARDLARSGFSVGIFDVSPPDRLGKPIIIEMQQDIFNRVGLDFPDQNMIPYHPERLRVFSARGKEAFQVSCSDYKLPVAVFLDRFVQKIHNEAVTAGAHFHGGYRALAPIVAGTGVEGVRFATPDGTAEIRARIVIDATGFNAGLTRQLPAELGIAFPADESHIVSAANHFHHIDTDAARSGVANNLHGDAETWIRLGNYGPYSTVFSFLSLEHQCAYILIGLKKTYEKTMPVGTAIDRFRSAQGYFGPEISGGAASIRIHHSLDRLVADNFMVIGEAACQVVPIHGSGVASALYAANLAAKAAAQALNSDDTSQAALWPYAAQYQRTRGRKLAAFDVVRLTLDALPDDDIAAMIESGLMNKEDIINGFLVKAPGISPTSLPSRAGGLIHNARLTPTIATMGLAIQKVKHHYANYPQRFDRKKFREWSEESAKLFAPLLKGA